eukprot:g16633.t1
MAPEVHHTLSPGRLVINVTGIDHARAFGDLDVKEDCVTFLANGERVLLSLAPGTHLEGNHRHFLKKDLIIAWQCEEPERDDRTCMPILTAGITHSPPPQVSPMSKEVHFACAASVRWAAEKLAILQIPETAEGFQRFKAEVGLAELAFYALRLARLGTPKALWPQLQAAEAQLSEALRRGGTTYPRSARTCGSPLSNAATQVMASVWSTVQRIAGAVEDVTMEVAEAPLLGIEANASASLAGQRWTLRDGRPLGPGIGTWKLSPSEAEESVAAALREGVRHVDTAAEYGTEEAVARGIQRAKVPRDEIFVNLKVAAETAEELREVIATSFNQWGAFGSRVMTWSSAHVAFLAAAGASVVALALTRSRRKVRVASALLRGRYGAEVAVAAQLALECGQAMRDCLQKKVDWKDTESIDPVTQTDQENEQRVIEGLRRAFPAHQLIGEESAAARAAAGLPPVALTVARQRPVETPKSLKESMVLFELGYERSEVAALTSLSNLTETSFCPSMREMLGLRKMQSRRSISRGDHLAGCSVQVHSLKSVKGQQLNGMLGVLVDFDEESGRWQLTTSDGRSRKMRPENLAMVTADTPTDTADERAAAAGVFLQEQWGTGSADDARHDAFLRVDTVSVDWALLETVSANLSFAESKGYAVKQQVLTRLLGEVKQVLSHQEPRVRTVLLPPPSLDATASWKGTPEESQRVLAAVSALLEAQGYAICDHFVSDQDVQLLAQELAAYDREFETAKIWVGKQASGAQLSVPTVRSDRIMWVCGEHRTPAREMLWDSAGQQPAEGLAPCRPEVVMAPRLQKGGGRLTCCATEISIYENGARFQKHVDNPNRDGRVLTSIVYLNYGEPWGEDDGGHLRMFLDGHWAIDLAPETGRLVLFWANELPHEVLPSKRRRMALTYWRLVHGFHAQRVVEAEGDLPKGQAFATQEFVHGGSCRISAELSLVSSVLPPVRKACAAMS